MWLADAGSYSLESNLQVEAFWGLTVYLTSLVISVFVNALVTGLIVFKIFKVYRGVTVEPFLYRDDGPTLNPNRYRATGGTSRRKLRPIMFMLIESGMMMFVIQLVRVVMVIWFPVFANLVIGINEMLFVIIISVIGPTYFY
jgi:hypothetical protein